MAPVSSHVVKVRGSKLMALTEHCLKHASVPAGDGGAGTEKCYTRGSLEEKQSYLSK